MASYSQKVLKKVRIKEKRFGILRYCKKVLLREYARRTWKDYGGGGIESKQLTVQFSPKLSIYTTRKKYTPLKKDIDLNSKIIVDPSQNCIAAFVGNIKIPDFLIKGASTLEIGIGDSKDHKGVSIDYDLGGEDGPSVYHHF